VAIFALVVALVAINKFVYVRWPVPDRLMRITGWMLVFICSLELLTTVLIQYGLPLSANTIIAWPSILHYYIASIGVIISAVLLIAHPCCSSSEEYEIGDYEDSEMCDDERNLEVVYYYDLVAANNNELTDLIQQQQQQQQQKEKSRRRYTSPAMANTKKRKTRCITRTDI